MSAQARAAEIPVMASLAFKEAYLELVPQFEKDPRLDLIRFHDDILFLEFSRWLDERLNISVAGQEEWSPSRPPSCCLARLSGAFAGPAERPTPHLRVNSSAAAPAVT
jgi:hypothetical protein